MSENQCMDIPEALRGHLTVDLWPTVGQLLDMGKNQTYEAARRGEIPTLRLGVRWKVPVAKLLDLLGISDQAA